MRRFKKYGICQNEQALNIKPKEKPEFAEREEIDKIVIVCHGSYVDYMQKLIDLYQISKADRLMNLGWKLRVGLEDTFRYTLELF